MSQNKVNNCSCRSINCSRHGNCKECIEHHNTHSNNKLPHCKRPGNSEAYEKIKKMPHVIC